jgi:hypothetical protein
MASTTQPTRSSSRIRERKKAAAEAAIAAIAATAATAAATVGADTATKNARKCMGKDKGKAKRRTAPSKVTKRAAVKKTTRAPAKKTNAAHHRFILAPEQLTTVLEQYQADGNHQMWVGGKFYAVDPGEEVPAGSVELEIKVPSGLKFLVFPGVVKLWEGGEMEEQGEMEMEEMEEGEMEEGEMEEDGEKGEKGEIEEDEHEHVDVDEELSH